MIERTPSFRWLLQHPDAFLAFGFGSGLARKLPGTAGTLAAVPLYLLLRELPLPLYLLTLVVTFAFGIWICDTASKKLGVHDHGGIVWDEFVGFWLTMMLAPPGVLWLILGFLLFRFFDMLKPWPIGWIDRRVHGGFGIMIDDVVAALPALACLQLTVYLVSLLN